MLADNRTHCLLTGKAIQKRGGQDYVCVCVWGSSRVSVGEQVEKLTPTVSEIVTNSTVTNY